MKRSRIIFSIISKALCMVVLSGITAPLHIEAQRSEYWKQRVSLFDIIPLKNSDIVFLGNSITDGGEFAELFNNPDVKNRGISSDVISGVMDRIGQVTDNSPSKIFLLIGINDVSHNHSIAELSSRYEMLVKEIRKRTPQTELYLQSLMPINNDFGRYRNLKGKEQTVKAFNEEIEKIATRNGAEYVDLWPALADPDTGKLKTEFTNDGLHLTGAGYKAWTDAVRPFVEHKPTKAD